MHKFRLFAVLVRSVILWAVMVFWGNTVYAQEKNIDTLHCLNAKVDTVWLGFEDVLWLSTLYDSADRNDWHYLYRWNTGERTDGIQVKFEGKRKLFYIGQRLSAIHWPDEYDTLELNVVGSSVNSGYLYVADYKDDTVILRAPDMEGENIEYEWSNDDYLNKEMLLPDTAQYAVAYRDMWRHLGFDPLMWFFCRATAVSDEGVPSVLQSSLMLSLSDKFNDGFVQTPAGICWHDYNAWSMLEGTRIYARLSDTLHFFSELNPDLYPEHNQYENIEFYSNTWQVSPNNRWGDVSQDSVINIYFKDDIYKSRIECMCSFWTPGTGSSTTTYHHIYWGIKPDAEIEVDSVWVFFPQYPYYDLGEDVNICLPPGAPLPAPDDTLRVFNLGPYNRDLDYVVYAWLDGTRDAAGRDSVVGTDSAFAYLFGRMDSVSPELYAGMLVTRVAADSMWQDSCGCYVPCTDDACHRYDTVRIYLHRLPLREQNLFLPSDTTLCAHLDLALRLPDTADKYRCFWLDRDSIVLPFGEDTNRFTIAGLRGTDGFGANTDSREPRFFQLRLDHKICSVSFFDTLLVYDQVRPAFELPFHDTVICLDEPVVLDSLSPLVYRPFYGFEWNDGTVGSGYSFTDSGTYILRFFVREDFDICDYDDASDTVSALWSDPAMTLISIPEDTAFCERLSVTLDASVPFPSTRYCWQEGNLDDLVPPTEDSTLFTPPVLKVDREVSYALFLLDTLGCLNTRQINIHEEDCKPKLEIPNVFTPNGDGINDVWRFTQLEKCSNVDILVVDRKGSHVLHEKVGNVEDFSWNGCYRTGSRKMPDGPYFYMVSYRDAYGKKKYQSGSITILGARE